MSITDARTKISNLRLARSGLLQILAGPLLCLMLGAGFWYWTVEHIETDKLAKEKQALAEATALCKDYAQYLAQAVDQASQITQQVHYSQEEHGQANLQELAKGGLFRSPRLQHVLVIGPDGRPLAAFPDAPPNLFLADRDYFRYHSQDDSDDLLIGKPLVSRSTGLPVVTFTRRLHQPNSAFDGVALVAFEPQHLTAFYAGSFPGKTGLLMAVGLDGTLRSATIGQGNADPQFSPLRAVPLFNAPEGAILLSGEQWFSDGKSRYVAWKTLEQYPLVAVAGISAEDFLAPHHKIWANDRRVAITVSGILALFAVISSGTARRHVRNRYQEEEVRAAYRLATEGGSDGYFMYEPLPGPGGAITDFVLVDCNERGAGFYGMTQLQLLQTKLSELYPPSHRAETVELFRSAMTTGFFEDEILAENEGKLQIPWAKRRFVRSGNGLSVMIQDISERKHAEQELRQMNERFILATQAGHIGVWDWDIKNNELVWDASMYRLYGIRQEDFGGAYDAWACTIHPEDKAHSECEIQAALRGEREYAIEFRIVRPDGTIRHLKADSRTFWDTDGTPLRMIGTNIDMTELKRAEEERISLEKQLLHAQKLESLGVLAGGIAHDFNNILTSIMGNTELAMMQLNPESPGVENLKRIEKSAARAADLARQMLAYSGKGKFVIETIDLNRLVEEIGHMLEVSISKRAELRYCLTQPLPAIEADATQIRQIVMNLVINASDAIGDTNGVIMIATGCQECTESYLQDAWLAEPLPEGLYVFLEVTDTGCGMDQETLAKIFDPFFTTKFTGRGLGMAAVLGIIRGHKGAIKISSEPGKGSTFTVLLPAAQKPLDLSNESAAGKELRVSGTVLLVDDEETVRQVGSEMLQSLGLQVLTANDGMQALEIFRSRSDIAFVILDLTMPHMDGEQCYRELRRLDPNAKVIISSGYSEHEVNQKFAGKGLAGFIQKPYKLSVISEAIKKIDN